MLGIAPAWPAFEGITPPPTPGTKKGTYLANLPSLDVRMLLTPRALHEHSTSAPTGVYSKMRLQHSIFTTKQHSTARGTSCIAAAQPPRLPTQNGRSLTAVAMSATKRPRTPVSAANCLGLFVRSHVMYCCSCCRRMATL